MSQNIIKIKRGGSGTPSLTAGELAYSYGGKKLFIGSETGQALEIGGENFVAGPTSIGYFTPNNGITTTGFLGDAVNFTGVNGVTVTGDGTDTVFFGLNVTGATKGDGSPIITVDPSQDGRLVIGIPNNTIDSTLLDPSTFIREFAVNPTGLRSGRLGFATPDKKNLEEYTGTTSSNFLAGGGETSFIDINPHYFGVRVGTGATSFVGVDIEGGSRLDTLTLTGTNGISISSSTPALTANTSNDTLTLTVSSVPRQYTVNGTSLTANINENVNFTGSSNISLTSTAKTITFSTVASPTFAGIAVTGNANVTGTLNVTGQSTLGNVTATGLTATTVRANTSVSTPQINATGGNFSGSLTAGSGSFGNLGVSGNLDVTGNLNVIGSLVTLDVQNVKVQDPIIALAKNNVNSDNLQSGFVVQYLADPLDNFTSFAGLIRDHITKRFVFFQNDSAAGRTVTSASYDLGNKASIEVAGISASGTIQSPTLLTDTILGAVIDGGTF